MRPEKLHHQQKPKIKSKGQKSGFFPIPVKFCFHTSTILMDQWTRWHRVDAMQPCNIKRYKANIQFKLKIKKINICNRFLHFSQEKSVTKQMTWKDNALHNNKSYMPTKFLLHPTTPCSLSEFLEWTMQQSPNAFIFKLSEHLIMAHYFKGTFCTSWIAR